jgi:hypothetical protein
LIIIRFKHESVLLKQTAQQNLFFPEYSLIIRHAQKCSKEKYKIWILWTAVITLYTTYFNVQEFWILRTRSIFIFLMILTINSSHFRNRIKKLVAFVTQTWRRKSYELGTAIMLRPGSPWNRRSVPSKGKRFHYYFTASGSALGPIQPFVQCVRGQPLPWVSRLRANGAVPPLTHLSSYLRNFTANGDITCFSAVGTWTPKYYLDGLQASTS